MRLAVRILDAAIVAGALAASAIAQASFRDDPTVITESGYSIKATSSGYRVNIALVLSNPFPDRFASNPVVQVTLKTADGGIISTTRTHSAGIPPKQAIAECLSLYVDEAPKVVDLKPLSALYEATDLKSSDIVPFTVQNLRSRETRYAHAVVTGEIKNPYPVAAGAWLVFLYRDKARKLLGGRTHYVSDIPARDTIPFEESFADDDIPAGTEAIDRLVFSHNNSQSTWQRMLKP